MLTTGSAALKDVYLGRPVEQLPQIGGRRMAKKKMPPLGSGERFEALKGELARKKGVTNPGGLAAFIGRKKLGAAKFNKLAAEGRKNH